MTLTEEVSCSRAFRKPKNANNWKDVTWKCYPSQQVRWKSSLWKNFSGIDQWWVNKNPVLQPCLFTIGKSWVQWLDIIANITAESLNVWLIKSVKEQSLILVNVTCTCRWCVYIIAHYVLFVVLQVIDNNYIFVHEKVERISKVSNAHLHQGLMLEPNVSFLNIIIHGNNLSS